MEFNVIIVADSSRDLEMKLESAAEFVRFFPAVFKTPPVDENIPVTEDVTIVRVE